MERYECIESFEVRKDWYGNFYGNNETVRIGDIYILVKEPTPQKKLYKLQKESDGKWDNGFLYLRKNFFKNHFKKIN